jgi:hypothetical protein
VGQGNGCCFVGIPAFVNDHAWYDSELRKDPYVIGYAAWTLGSWAGANWQTALLPMRDYILSQP